jgi:hypothetical protein
MEDREIDFLIFEHIFGNEKGFVDYLKEQKDALELNLSIVNRYSTDIKDAWKIVNKLKQEDQYYFRLENGDLKDYGCIFSDYQDNYFAEADTPALAICKAALKAKGIII